MTTDQVVTETRTTQIGETLREWRLDNRLTIDEFTSRMHSAAPHLRKLSREYVRRYELGAIDRRQLDLPYLTYAAKSLGHDVRELGPDVAVFVDDLFAAMKPRRSPRGPGSGLKGGASSKRSGSLAGYSGSPRSMPISALLSPSQQSKIAA